MGSRLTVETRDVDDVTFVTLAGFIDEDNDLSEITAGINNSTAVIRTANVERINSCGVRDWVNWLGELDRAGIEYHLAECSPAMMAQVNTVNNFVGQGHMLSFFAPYYCPSCDKEKMLLLDVAEALATSPFTTPVCRCDDCDLHMEFDDIETSYFEFLTKVRPSPQPIVEAAGRFSSAGRLRSRTIPMSPISSSISHESLTDRRSISSLHLPAPGMETTPSREGGVPQPGRIPSTLLYLIAGLLAVAVVLLIYLAVRSL